MAKNIQWKKSTIDYDKLNELTPRAIASAINMKLGNKILNEKFSDEELYEIRSKGGTTSGNNAAESRQYHKFNRIRTDSSSKARMERTKEYKKLFYDLLPNTDFKMNDQLHLVSSFQNMKDDQMFRIWIRDTLMFECLGKRKGSGNSKWYRKIKTN